MTKYAKSGEKKRKVCVKKVGVKKTGGKKNWG